MEFYKIGTTILVVLAFIPAGTAEIVTKPTATEVVVGGSTFLNCSTNGQLKINWFLTKVGADATNFIYSDGTIRTGIGRLKVEVDKSNGAYNLVITSVKMEEAGLYGCEEEGGQGSKHEAQLIVLDSRPVCEPHFDTHEIIEPNQLIMSCRINYNGNEAPIMEWRKASDNTTVTEEVTYAITDNKRVVYNLTVQGNNFRVRDGESYLCITKRAATENYWCKSGKINVKGTENVDCPPVDSGEICKPYSNAIICIIVLSIVVSGIVFAIWYLRFYRPKKRHQEGNSEESPQEPVNDQEMISLTSSAASQEKNENKSNKISDLQSEIYNRKMNIDKDAPIRSLQSKVTSSDEELQKKSDEIRKLQEQHEYYKRQVNEEIIQLKASVNSLEQRLYPAANLDYVEKPTLVHTITADVGKERREPISGMTILGKELFVSHENKSEIEVHDSETFQFVRNWTIEGILHPMDMASCKIANCVYIIFRVVSESNSHIMKLDPNGQLIKNWPTGGDSGRLSTYKSNVIVCLFEKQLIIEYTRDGILIQTVPLSPAVGFNHPWHAIKITNSHFVVCHGDTKDALHRVCIVDDQGTIKRELRRWEKTETIEGKLNVPICLVEDNSGRSILVADRDNKKIRHLNCFLKRKNNLISALDGYPVRVCLDETKGRLFVAENTLRSNKRGWKDGRVLVFNTR